MKNDDTALTIQQRIAILEEYIQKNPHASAVEREQLQELKEQQRKMNSKGKVQY